MREGRAFLQPALKKIRHYNQVDRDAETTKRPPRGPAGNSQTAFPLSGGIPQHGPQGFPKTLAGCKSSELVLPPLYWRDSPKYCKFSGCYGRTDPMQIVGRDRKPTREPHRGEGFARLGQGSLAFFHLPFSCKPQLGEGSLAFFHLPFSCKSTWVEEACPSFTSLCLAKARFTSHFLANRS